MDFHENCNVHALGINVDSYLDVENYETGWWDEINEVWHPVTTNDLQISYRFNTEVFEGYNEVEITDINLSMYQWFDSWREQDMLNVYFSGEGYCHTPEPATLCLLAIGGLGFLRRGKSL